MEDVISNAVLIAGAILSLDLIVSGIIGLKTKTIYSESLLWRIVFFPLGVFSKIFTWFADNAYDPQHGKAAIVASISAIATGVLILTFFIFGYLATNELVPYGWGGNIVRIIMVSLLIIVPVVVIISVSIYKRQEKRAENK